MGLFGGGQTKQEKAIQANISQQSTNLMDAIAPASYVVGPNFLQLNELYVRTIFVYAFPHFLNTNWMSPIVNSDVVMDISIYIKPLESKTFVGNLRKQQGKLESSRQIEQEKGLVRNPELDTAIQDIDALREDLMTGQQKIYQLGLYFTIYAKSIDELNTATDQIESTLGSLVINTKQTIFQMEQGFNTTLPLATDQINVYKNLDTNSISTTFPFVSATLSNNEGILYGINRHNSSLILFDRFKLENANMVVFAKSGAGKSYSIKLEALRSLMMGVDVIVIDPESEYVALCNAVGGSYFDMSLNSEKRINPFDLPKGNTDEPGDVVLRTAIADLTGLVALMVGGMSPEEAAILDKALYDTYALRDITNDSRTHANPPPLLQDLRNVMSNMNGAQSLVQRLSKYVEGSFAGLFNQPTNFELDRGFVAFSIRNLEDQLRPIGMYMILNYVWSKIRHDLRKRLLIIDEAWLMMQYEDSARYIFSLAKRARKYYLGLTIISQDVEDFLNSQHGRAVLNNSSLQLLLKQSPTAVEKLAEVFNLTEGEKFLLLESNVGEGLFFAGSSHVAIQIVASYAEDQIITTDPSQILAARQAKEEADTATQVISPDMPDSTSTPEPSPAQMISPTGPAPIPSPPTSGLSAPAPAATAPSNPPQPAIVISPATAPPAGGPAPTAATPSPVAPPVGGPAVSPVPISPPVTN